MERKLLIAIGNTGLDKISINYLLNLFRGKNDIAFHLFSVMDHKWNSCYPKFPGTGGLLSAHRECLGPPWFYAAG